MFASQARHRPASAAVDSNGDCDQDVVLGTFAVPLLPVLQSTSGVDGEYELLTDAQQPVGKLQVNPAPAAPPCRSTIHRE